MLYQDYTQNDENVTLHTETSKGGIENFPPTIHNSYVTCMLVLMCGL